MSLKLCGFAAVACCLALLPRSSFADTTLKLVGTGSATVNLGPETAYVYPYNFSINGSPTSTALMCLNANDTITMNEQWDVNVDTLAQAAATTPYSLNEYEEDAWLYSQVTSANDVEYQFAVWSVFDPAIDTSADPYWVSNSGEINTLLSNAAAAIATEPPSFFNQFVVYVPAPGTYNASTGYPDGLPQSFIGEVPAATPEPGSLALLGTGLLGMVGVLKRKMLKA